MMEQSTSNQQSQEKLRRNTSTQGRYFLFFIFFIFYFILFYFLNWSEFERNGVEEVE